MIPSEQRKQVGLALGGGVVRGRAHIGVLSVLAEAGIPVDYVAGTSVGAIMGALFCAGLDPAEMLYIASKIGWGDLARPVWPRKGLVSFEPLEHMLVTLLGDLDFASLEIPLATVCVDLESGNQVVVSDGRLAPAVRASASVPGIVEPIHHHGHLLGDGGVVNNLPVSVVQEMGAEYVIAVDVFEPSYVRGLGPLGMGITALEVLVSRAGAGADAADCVIRPALAGHTYFIFSSRPQLFELGRQATLAVLPQLKQDLALPLAAPQEG